MIAWALLAAAARIAMNPHVQMVVANAALVAGAAFGVLRIASVLIGREDWHE